MAAATPIPPAPIEIPLPFSVSREAIEPTIVTSSPSRIQTVPRPMTTSQWKRDHGSRSRRPGMFVSMTPVWTLTAAVVPPADLRNHGGQRAPRLPPAGPSPPLPRRRRHHDVGLRTVRRGRLEDLSVGGGGGPVRRG